jgi:hypothetical protein
MLNPQNHRGIQRNHFPRRIINSLKRALRPNEIDNSSAWTVERLKENNAIANIKLPVIFFICQPPDDGID